MNRGQKSEVRSQKWMLAAAAVVFTFAFCLLTSAFARQPSSIYGRDTTQVYVRDSAIAIEKFALDERMERLHEWSKAADVYQDVLANYADRVVPSLLDKDNRISTLLSEIDGRPMRFCNNADVT